MMHHPIDDHPGGGDVGRDHGGGDLGGGGSDLGDNYGEYGGDHGDPFHAILP